MPRQAPVTSAKMKRHDSVRRFIVADAYDRSKSSLSSEYNKTSGKYTTQAPPENKLRKKRESIVKKKAEDLGNAGNAEKMVARSMSAEALDTGTNQALDSICKKPSSFIAHSASHQILHEGLEESFNRIVDNPYMLLAHVATRGIMLSALDHLGGSHDTDGTSAVPDDYNNEFHEENLLQLLHQAQAILSKHQSARKNGLRKEQTVLGKSGKWKSRGNKRHIKSLFRKSSSIDLIESTSTFNKTSVSYDALYMPPFAKSSGPNISRYKASCIGDYEGKRLIDNHGTGIGVTLESLREAAAKAPQEVSKNSDKKQNHCKDFTMTWPSSAIQQAADSWVEKQRRHVDDARNLKHGAAGKKAAGTTVDRSLEERAHETYTWALGALVSRLDMVFTVAFCGECRNHVTLRHHEDKYQLLAYDTISRLMLSSLSWRIPFRVGALTLPRRASLAMQTKQAYNKIKDALDLAPNVPGNQRPSEADLTSLLIRKCCASVPVGSFEVMMACRDESGTFHYIKLFSKLETQKFPSPNALVKRLGAAIEQIIGVAPEKLLKAFYDDSQREGDDPQLTVPSCAYPETCRRGCQINKVDSYTLEDLRTVDEISDLIGIKLQPFEPSELELGLGSLSTPEEVVWVADFSLESKHHLFSVGDIVDVRQVAPLTLSPRRKRNTQRHSSKSAVLGDGGPEQQAPSMSLSKFRLEEFYVQQQASVDPLPPTSLMKHEVHVSSMTRVLSLSESVVSVMESHAGPGPVAMSRPYSPPRESGLAAQVYSPVRTAAYLRRTGAGSTANTAMLRPGSPHGRMESLLERGLDTRIPFSNNATSAQALVPPQKSVLGVPDHHSPFKVSKVIERDTAHARGGTFEFSEEGQPEPMWYNQGFLRGIIRSAHRDGTYDIEYLPQEANNRNGGDDDDDESDEEEKECGNIYIADSYPTFSGKKTQRRGFVDIGVPQAFVTTVRSRNTLKEEAEMVFTLQQMHKATLDASGSASQRFIFTHSDQSLSRERRPWRKLEDQEELSQLQVRLRAHENGGENLGTGPFADKDDDSSFGDVDDFIRGAMTGDGGNVGSTIDQRDDKFTPCELQAYAPIAHLA